MTKNHLPLAALLTATLLTACSGGVPNTTDPGSNPGPGFYGLISKNGAPQAGRWVWLKSYAGEEGSLKNGEGVPGSATKSDGNGRFYIPAPASAVAGGAYFGLGYDVSNTAFNGTVGKDDARQNPDEIQWFSTPAYNLNTKQGNKVNVDFDLGWDTTLFYPTYNAVVANKNVVFNLPHKANTSALEVTVFKGTVPAKGEQMFNDKGPGTLTWNNAPDGQYNYHVKAHLPNGVAGVTGNSQEATSSLMFSVDTRKL